MKFWIIWDKFGIYLMCALILIVFGAMAPLMFTSRNIFNVLVTASITAITAAGMTFAITSGRFDLSVGSIMALSTCLVGIISIRIGFPWSLILPFIAAILIGVFNGFIITKLKIQAFVATLATMVIIKGLAFLLTDGKDIYFVSYPQIKFITMSRLLGIPLPLWITAIIYILLFLIYKFTPFGVYVRSIGTNESSSRMSGIRVDIMIIWVFIITAICATASGIIAVSQTLNGNAHYGANLILDSITATILGGTSLKGGKGKIFGTLIAAILLSIIRNGLNLLNVSIFYQNFSTGLILILVLLINGIREAKSEKLKQNV